MKVKTSITLSEDVLVAVDQLSEVQGNGRSKTIETAIRAYLRQRARADWETSDLDILNRSADRLNAEALDVLEYQVVP